MIALQLPLSYSKRGCGSIDNHSSMEQQPLSYVYSMKPGRSYLFAEFLEFICNKLYLGSNDDLYGGLAWTHHASHTGGLDQLFIDLGIILCQLLLSVLPECHFSWYLPTGSCVGDSALWSDASGSGIAFQRLLVDYDIRSLYAADRRSVCRSYRHWSSHADTFILLFMGTAQADQRAFLHGIFSHAAGFQKQIVHGHLSFYH